MFGLQLTPWIVPYILAAAICCWIALRSWKMIPTPGAAYFAAAMWCWCIWAVGDILYLFGSQLSWKLFVVRFEFFGITGAIFFWGLFVLDYTGTRRPTKPIIAGLALVPAVMLVLVQTLHMHNLIYTYTGTAREGSFVVLDRVIGPAFWAWAAYAYCILLLGSVAFIRFAFRSPQVMRDQAFLLVIGTIFPTVANMLYLTGNNPIRPLDPSSLTFTLSGLLVYYGFRRYSFLELAPVAYDLVFKSANIAVIVLDFRGRIVELNPKCESVLGISRKQVVGKEVGTSFPEHKNLVRRFVDGNETREEIKLRNRDYEMEMIPLKQRGRTAGRLILLHDITDRLFTARIIQESEARYRALFENNPYPSLVFDRNALSFLAVNAAAIEKYGYSEKEFLSMKLSDLEPEEDRVNTPKHTRNTWPARHLTKANKMLHVEISSHDLSFQDRQAKCIVIRDVTQQKLIERLKNEFISTVSHELRTPLSSIRAAIGLIGSQETDPSESKHLLLIAETEADRMGKLLNDILDIEKIESGNWEFHFKPVEMTALVKEAIEGMRPFANRYKSEIYLRNTHGDSWVLGDRNRIIQVVMNLLANAAKFSKPNLPVLVQISKHDEKIRVSITDQGPGISDDFQNRIFEKYAQADSSNTRKHGGTGLGLSISKAIIEKHHGSIGFESKLNEGSTFFFDLSEIL